MKCPVLIMGGGPAGSAKRERKYDAGEETSIPIGSRYHPERASIWEVGDPRVGIDITGDLVRE